MKTSWLKWTFLLVVVILAAAWIYGAAILPAGEPASAPGHTALFGPQDDLMRRACFDCHSYETRYPWYARLPVVSILIANHVREGRRELNFSNWDSMNAEARGEALAESRETLLAGKMPPPGYALMNAKARLSPGEKQQLAAGISGLMSRMGYLGENGHESGEKGERDDD